MYRDLGIDKRGGGYGRKYCCRHLQASKDNQGHRGKVAEMLAHPLAAIQWVTSYPQPTSIECMLRALTRSAAPSRYPRTIPLLSRTSFMTSSPVNKKMKSTKVCVQPSFLPSSADRQGYRHPLRHLPLRWSASV